MANFTTPEQSRLLMGLGVPKDSADCYMAKNGVGICTIGILQEKYTSFARRTILYGVLPCWSVGRLIEICLKCSTLEQRQVRFFCNGDDDEYSLIDYVVTALESGVMTNHMDFSKMEEQL